MATNKYANESILYGSNDNIPYNLRGQNMIKDDLMNSVGLYSKKDIEEAATKLAAYEALGSVEDLKAMKEAAEELVDKLDKKEEKAN